MPSEAELQHIKPLRYIRKVTDGHSLYLVVRPKGGRYWRFNYRFAGVGKTLSLGIYPDVPLELARSRREFSRNLLDHGLDPSALKVALGKHVFIRTMREWEAAQARPF